ncbi:MAG: hypothetical protein M1530_00485 [Candidatus Marsarchaeota archaeon]|nr:hypothetical protein [Candidatus Marsarchaeota archaeon]
MELQDAVTSVADRLGVSFKELFSAMEKFVASMKDSRNSVTRAHARIKLDLSRSVQLADDVLGPEKIPVITLTQNVRLGLSIQPGGDFGKKGIAVRLMRGNGDALGLYNPSALTSGEISSLKRIGPDNAPMTSPGLASLRQVR